MSTGIKIAVWVGLTLIVFSLFNWLFNIAIPELALAFSLGITVIIIGGLLAGRYASGIWFKVEEHAQNRLLWILSISLLLSLFTIVFLVNRMINNTEFMHFSFTIIFLFLANACFGALVTLIRHRIRSKIHAHQTALNQSKAELQLLQSQLSPHFLFNILNSIYGLSISNHEEVPPLLLKLSELLRYAVYDAKEIFVPIQQELDYLKNYIEFENIRLGERLDLAVNLEATDNTLRIPPMMLIVFVENAFKHGRSTHGDKIYINITLANKADEIIFSVINSCLRSGTRSKIINRHSGIGLESVKKRLDLLYSNNYALKINESPSEFAIELKLKKDDIKVPDYR